MSVLCDYFGFLLLNYCVITQPVDNQVYQPPIRTRSASKFSVDYQWRYINFTWPSFNAYSSAVQNKEYIPQNNAMAGIKIYKDNIYIALPRARPKGTPVTLAYVPLGLRQQVNPLLRPYPSWNFNVKKDCHTLQSVQSMEIDSKGVMWVIDGMRLNNASSCPAKLVLFDLNNNNKIVRTYVFPKNVALNKNGYLNDIVIDETNGTFAYISDPNPVDPGLVVYSYARNKAWKIRDKTMFAEIEAAGFVVEGLPMKQLMSIDGIALSPAKSKQKFVYFSALVGYKLYAISTSILQNEKACQADSWRKEVKLIGSKQSQSDGMMMDNTGDLYYTLLPLYGVGKWNSSTSFAESEILDQDHEIHVWPDSFTFDNRGYIYVLSDNINKFLDTSYPLKLSSKILFRIAKHFTGTKSYLHL